MFSIGRASMPGQQQHRCVQEEQTDPRSARWTVLFLTCGALFGQFYAFDIPSALNEQMKELLMGTTHITEQQYVYYFNLLYSVYSVPNVFLPLVMGLAVDCCGYRKLIVVLTTFVVIGQFVFSVGVGAASWSTMMLGRVLFGFGAESLQVAQNTMLFRWFKGQEVAFALGLNLSVARAGSVLNDIVSPWAAEYVGVNGVLGFGFLLCCAGLVCSRWSITVDVMAGQKAALPDATNKEEVSLSDALKLPRQYWLLVAFCVIIYCAVLPFNNIASAFFVETSFKQQALADAQLSAGRAMSLLFLVSALGTPLFGRLVDRLGMRIHFLLLSCVVLTASYSLIFILPPAYTMLGLGTVYTIFAGALWPSIALVVPQDQLGTAYGIAIAAQNAGLALMPLLIGHLQAQAGKGHFETVMHVFMLLGVAAAAVCVLLFHASSGSNDVLNLPSGEAEKYQKKTERTPLNQRKSVASVL